MAWSVSLYGLSPVYLNTWFMIILSVVFGTNFVSELLTVVKIASTVCVSFSGNLVQNSITVNALY